MLKLSLDASGQPLSNELQLAMQFRLEKKRLLLHAINEIGKQIQVRQAGWQRNNPLRVSQAVYAMHVCCISV